MVTIATRQSFLPWRPCSKACAKAQSMVLKSESKNAPADGFPLPNCMGALTEIQSVHIEAREAARRIAEVIGGDAHPVHHGEKKIAHRRFAARHYSAAGLEIVPALA